jgi:DNA-nicking Smr family endonuclease
MNEDDDGGDAVELPIEAELDLHSFAPRDVVSVVDSYLDACRERNLLEVRLIHGRGRGVQRAEIRRHLSRRADVLQFEDAPPASGGWGATLVRLRSMESG